jgi:hypothetical protein
VEIQKNIFGIYSFIKTKRQNKIKREREKNKKVNTVAGCTKRKKGKKLKNKKNKNKKQNVCCG